jgi:hypothetical protein
MTRGARITLRERFPSTLDSHFPRFPWATANRISEPRVTSVWPIQCSIARAARRVKTVANSWKSGVSSSGQRGRSSEAEPHRLEGFVGGRGQQGRPLRGLGLRSGHAVSPGWAGGFPDLMGHRHPVARQASINASCRMTAFPRPAMEEVTGRPRFSPASPRGIFGRISTTFGQ